MRTFIGTERFITSLHCAAVHKLDRAEKIHKNEQCNTEGCTAIFKQSNILIK